MKVKSDFVTNSSSASFILYVEAFTTSLSDFTELFNDFLSRWEGMYSRDYENTEPPPMNMLTPQEIKQNGMSSLFKVCDWTSMYNGQADIPNYMRWLIIEQNLKGSLEEFGFKSVKLKIVEDG